MTIFDWLRVQIILALQEKCPEATDEELMEAADAAIQNFADNSVQPRGANLPSFHIQVMLLPVTSSYHVFKKGLVSRQTP